MTLNKVTVALNGLMTTVAKVIRNDWSPGELAGELQYRNALLSFLRDVAPQAHIEPEYRHMGTTCDLHLAWPGIVNRGEVFIELKHNLRQKSEYDRLIGQIEQLNPRSNQIIVVFCGAATSDTLVSRFQERYRDVIDLDFFPGFGPNGALTIVVKCPVKPQN
ncbi:MAG TPA: hypothetical protein VNK82_01975 [Terriglobales bacterium]|nr:hypothetical protein [Terriglobales bacterium]